MMADRRPPKIPFVFYATVAGNEPVRDWLKRLVREDRLYIGADLQRAQYRWPIGMPLCRPLGDGLFEVRTNLPSKTTARVFICVHDDVLYALHGFIKKTQQAPNEDLKIARRRKKDVEDA